MNAFTYQDGELYCDDVSALELAHRYGTPLYVYSRDAFVKRFCAIRDAFSALNPRVCYSIKSCHNIHILRLLREQGASFDAVSIGEVIRAIRSGADPADIDFAGVGKTDDELREALRLGVGWFNVESPAELERLAALADHLKVTAQAALRVMPDVDARTHPYITTGVQVNKFGVELNQARALFTKYAHHQRLKLSGVHMHIGSLVRSPDPYAEAIQKVLALIDEVQAGGVTIDSINIGGGFAIAYDDKPVPAVDDYAARIVPLLAERSLQVHLEPGRCIAADSGVLLTRITYVKEQCGRTFLITDAGMTDLLRPALYGAYHFIWPVRPGKSFIPPDRSQHQLSGTSPMDVVGPICESSDFFAKDRHLPPCQAGDVLCVHSSGAYGSVMAGQYNSRPRAAEVLVSSDRSHLIRRRETIDDLLAPELESEL